MLTEARREQCGLVLHDIFEPAWHQARSCWHQVDSLGTSPTRLGSRLCMGVCGSAKKQLRFGCGSHYVPPVVQGHGGVDAAPPGRLPQGSPWHGR